MSQNSSVFNLLFNLHPQLRHPRLQSRKPMGTEWKPIDGEIHGIFFHRSLGMQSVSPNLISIKIQIIWKSNKNLEKMKALARILIRKVRGRR